MVTASAIEALLEDVHDPEIPTVSIADLGILRGVEVAGDTVEITITPTYCGCPAVDTIRADIVTALNGAGLSNVRIREQLSPAWTTDWVSERGRRQLLEAGIAPPAQRGCAAGATGGVNGAVACVHCASEDTEMLSEFGSTACKSLYRCRACGEPFDYFKCI